MEERARIGRTVRIFMADGDAFGVQQIEIFNRTLQALIFPRARIREIQEWPESQRKGVYFLCGTDPDGRDSCYIGEAVDVQRRVVQHTSDTEDFWTVAVLFTSKDENLNHKYLEARLIKMATDADRYTVKNHKQQMPIRLSRAETDAMEELLQDIRLLLGVCGHRVLEPVARHAQQPPLPEAQAVTLKPSRAVAHEVFDKEFTFSFKDISATGSVTDEGFLVLKGSTAARNIGSLGDGYRALRDKLVQEQTLVEQSDKYVFQKDYLFSSPSAAASVVAGGNRNGLQLWMCGTQSVGAALRGPVPEISLEDLGL